MELGLGKFLEMFERRFGSAPTTILLALMGLGIAVLCLTWIWRAAVGIYLFLISETTWAEATLRGLWPIVIMLVIGIPAAFVVREMITRKSRRYLTEAKAIYEMTNKKFEELQALQQEKIGDE